MSIPYRKQRGFTLIEIMIATVILSLGLVTLLGLQSSVIQRTVRDRHKQQAMLIARRILSEYEIGVREVKTGSSYNDANSAIRESELAGTDPLAEADFSNYFVNTDMQEIEIPRIYVNDEEDLTDPYKMLRLLLTVSWSNDPMDKIEVLYYIPDTRDQFE